MGKATRKKQEQLDLREKNTLKYLSQFHAEKPPRGAITIATPGVSTDRIDQLSEHYIRDFKGWVYKGKSKNKENQRLDLIRYLFAKYPVPHFLERIMTVHNAPADMEFETRYNAPVKWYLAVAQGKSLYKTCTRDFLSKRETHLLLQAPNELKLKEAIWWAKTMAISNDVGVAYRMARSIIAVRGAPNENFWVDVHRFFTNNPVPLKEMEELIDYAMAERRENNNWTIKKRSLESVRRKSEIWHRAQFKMKRIGGGSWNGMDILDWSVTRGKAHHDPHKNTLTEWKIRQIVTGNDLVREGQKMHHCVGSYKTPCMEGRSAIFSMTKTTQLKGETRSLTIEVDVKGMRIVQARGYANRSPYPQESEIMNEWAIKNGIKLYFRSRY